MIFAIIFAIIESNTDNLLLDDGMIEVINGEIVSQTGSGSDKPDYVFYNPTTFFLARLFYNPTTLFF